MTVSKVLMAALLATSAFAMPVFAATAPEGAQQLATADSIEGRATLYSSLIGSNLPAAEPLMDAVNSLCTGPASVKEDAVCNPLEGSTILKEILAYLKANGASDELLSSLAEKYATLLAMGSTDVEPAAGPEEGFTGTGEDFGGTDENGETLENPNQVSGNQ